MDGSALADLTSDDADRLDRYGLLVNATSKLISAVSKRRIGLAAAVSAEFFTYRQPVLHLFVVNAEFFTYRRPVLRLFRGQKSRQNWR